MKSKLETIKRDVYDDIKDIISLDKIEEIALKTKFIQRNKNKITAENFFNLNIFSEVNICKDSLNNLCNLIFVEENVLISPQALDERFNEKAVNFF